MKRRLVEALPPPGDERHHGVTVIADCTADDTVRDRNASYFTTARDCVHSTFYMC